MRGTEKSEPSPDYRLILIDIAQRLIFQIMEVIGKYHFDDPSIWNDALEARLSTRRCIYTRSFP